MGSMPALRVFRHGPVKYRFTAGCQRSGGIGAHLSQCKRGPGPQAGRARRQARSRWTPVRASDEPEQGATMNRKSQRAEIALHRARVSDSFQELLAGTEDLLRSTASYTGSEIEAARERLKRQLAEARESAGEWGNGGSPARPPRLGLRGRGRARACLEIGGRGRAGGGAAGMLPGLGRPALNDRGGMSAAGRLPPKAPVGRGAGRDGRPPAEFRRAPLAARACGPARS